MAFSRVCLASSADTAASGGVLCALRTRGISRRLRLLQVLCRPLLTFSLNHDGDCLAAGFIQQRVGGILVPRNLFSPLKELPESPFDDSHLSPKGAAEKWPILRGEGTDPMVYTTGHGSWVLWYRARVVDLLVFDVFQESVRGHHTLRLECRGDCGEEVAMRFQDQVYRIRAAVERDEQDETVVATERWVCTDTNQPLGPLECYLDIRVDHCAMYAGRDG
ncbi:hypothetical protein C8J57DRAFT_1257765 [Mycena rebaudengoi]|nr:hypothetical protein C8J57DRAFT_1257765 [Mycena rebaudengoi]